MNDIYKYVKEARKLLVDSKDFYAKANKIIVDSLKINSLNINKEKTYIANLNDLVLKNRGDVELYQPH